MPRDANGNFSLVAGNPVIPGTVIEADWANPTMSDIAAALTDSLSRTGSGGMLVPFKTADGTMIAPGASWVNEPTSGWYRAALNDFWYSVGNENIFRITKAGIELAPGKAAVNIASSTRVADVEPVPLSQGEEWFESDTGGFYMRYVNPDATMTLIALGQTGGDFVPFAMKGAPNGVAELGPDGKLPAAQVPGGGLPGGFATLDVNGKVPLVQLPVSELTPTGVIWDFGGAVVPTGWLACDGAAVSRTTFAALFTAIGTVWGAGDGSTTFNVPDLRGRVGVGSGTGTLSAAGGDADVDITANTLTVPSNPDKWITGQQILWTVAGSVSPLISGNSYFVIRNSATTLKLANTLAEAVAGTAIDFTAKSAPTWTISAALTPRTLGQTFGEETHAQTIAEMPSHIHTFDTGENTGGGIAPQGIASPVTKVNNTNSAGGSAPMNTMQPSGVVLKIIKT
jgi:microcystin-dependent protein